MEEKVITSKNALTATADAIREKIGSEDLLEWTEGSGFANAIAAIETGGGSPSVSVTSKDVNFIDYDGTLLYSYTLEEAKALTELPPLPSHDGLVCQGWNYNLATIKNHNREVTVGAMYTTDDGKTRIYISLQDGRTSPMLGCCPNGTVTVDWGDGSATEALTGTSVSTVKWTSNHQYTNPGDYVITLTVDGSMGFYGDNSSNAYSGVLRFSSESEVRNRVYQDLVTKIEIGNGVMYIGTYAFSNCHSLASIMIPDGVTNIGAYVFSNCHSLTSIMIPDGVTTIGNYEFQYCYSLTSIMIPDGVTSIGSNAFRDCYSLTSIMIPDGVTSIGSNAFNGCYGVRYYDFSRHTSVPTLSASNAFSDIPADCEIRVPAALADEWKAATNWSTYASQIVGV